MRITIVAIFLILGFLFLGIHNLYAQADLVVKGDTHLATESGNVGIGTTSPAGKLQVTGGSAIFDGNVGIGTTSPNNRLQVAGLVNFDNSLSSIFLGSGAGNVNAGSYNTGVGPSSLLSNTTGRYNTALGFQSLRDNTTGEYNTAVGPYSLLSNTTGSYNTALGFCSLYYSEGVSNTALGSESLRKNTTGSYNTALGRSSLLSNTTGASNTAVGCQAGYGVSGNSFSNATLLGCKAGYALTIGSNNVLLGYQAGDNITSGSNNLIIGYDIDAPLDNGSYQLSIGNLIFGTNLNGTAKTISTGNVGIGTTSPTAGSRLHVKGGHIRVENGSFIDDGTTLTVPDYVFEPEYNLKSLLEVERFVLKHKHLEGLPGIGDTEGWAALSMQDRDMKLLEKIEELMLYVIEQQKRIEKLEQRLSKLGG